MESTNENFRNYQRELEKIIKYSNSPQKSVLLHSCCGPCSTSVLEFLTDYFNVTLLWYNPNLYPESEFEKRYATQLEVIEKLGLSDRVRVIREKWRSDEYYTAVSGLENEPEGGKRCEACFKLRLGECARIAKEQKFDYFCTTLTVSRYKNAVLINRVGEEISSDSGVLWLPSDFKKRGGEMRSARLSNEFGLYQQKYCGCEYSLRNREEYEKMHSVKNDV